MNVLSFFCWHKLQWIGYTSDSKVPYYIDHYRCFYCGTKKDKPLIMKPGVTYHLPTGSFMLMDEEVEEGNGFGE